MKTSPLCAALLLIPSLSYCQKTPILFQHVRVFDGNQVIPDTDVLIEKGLIKQVGPSLSAERAKLVDGTGKTLLPGLIDAYVHVHGADTLEQALIFGVTTEFDMMMQPRVDNRPKAEDNDPRAPVSS